MHIDVCTTIIIYSILLVWLKGMRIMEFTKRKSADCPAKSKSQCKQDHPHERTCVLNTFVCSGGKKAAPTAAISWKIVRYTRAHSHTHIFTSTYTCKHSSTQAHLHPSCTYICIYTQPYYNCTPFGADVKHSKLKFNND